MFLEPQSCEAHSHFIVLVSRPGPPLNCELTVVPGSAFHCCVSDLACAWHREGHPLWFKKGQPEWGSRGEGQESKNVVAQEGARSP